MRQRTWQARVKKLLTEEKPNPERYWYLSFADDTGFLGGITVKAPGFATAVLKTHSLGINPGGECLGAELPEDAEVPPQWIDRLISKTEMERDMGGVRKFD